MKNEHKIIHDEFVRFGVNAKEWKGKTCGGEIGITLYSGKNP